jgi:hypothetical protein
MLILEEILKNIFLVFNAGPCFSWQSLRWHILFLTNPMMLQGLVRHQQQANRLFFIAQFWFSSVFKKGG